MTVRLALVALCAAALTVPSAAVAQSDMFGIDAASLVGNDVSSAVQLPPSPVNSTLDYAPNDSSGGAPNDGDVYSVYLKEGQTFSAKLMGPVGSDFVLTLYAPGTASVHATDAPVVAETIDVYYPRVLSDYNTFGFGYVAPQSGVYFAEVYTYSGTGAYNLEWAIGAKPTVNISPSRTITYGKPTKVSGSVVGTDGAGLEDQRVELYARSYLTNESEYRRVALASTTAGGAYSFGVAPKFKTFYKVVALPAIPGYSYGQSAERTVKVRILLTRPYAPTTVARGRTFTTYGYMKPKHNSGSHTVYVYKYRWEKRANGTYGYVYKSRARTTNYNNSSAYPTKTKYLVRTTLPSRGTWRLVAKALDDGKHATTLSTPTKIRVR
jgi:hypothetical protein